jgi:hypothetical protein
LNLEISTHIFLQDFFTHIRRIQGKCLSVHGKYGIFRVVKITSEYLPYIMENSLDRESKAYNGSQKVYRWDKMLKSWGNLKNTLGTSPESIF